MTVFVVQIGQGLTVNKTLTVAEIQAYVRMVVLVLTLALISSDVIANLASPVTGAKLKLIFVSLNRVKTMEHVKISVHITHAPVLLDFKVSIVKQILMNVSKTGAEMELHAKIWLILMSVPVHRDILVMTVNTTLMTAKGLHVKTMELVLIKSMLTNVSVVKVLMVATVIQTLMIVHPLPVAMEELVMMR